MRRRRRRPSVLRISVYPSIELLQQLEEAMGRAGLTNRSDLVCNLLERWILERAVAGKRQEGR